MSYPDHRSSRERLQDFSGARKTARLQMFTAPDDPGAALDVPAVPTEEDTVADRAEYRRQLESLADLPDGQLRILSSYGGDDVRAEAIRAAARQLLRERQRAREVEDAANGIRGAYHGMSAYDIRCQMAEKADRRTRESIERTREHYAREARPGPIARLIDRLAAAVARVGTVTLGGTRDSEAAALRRRARQADDPAAYRAAVRKVDPAKARRAWG